MLSLHENVNSTLNWVPTDCWESRFLFQKEFLHITAWHKSANWSCCVILLGTKNYKSNAAVAIAGGKKKRKSSVKSFHHYGKHYQFCNKRAISWVVFQEKEHIWVALKDKDSTGSHTTIPVCGRVPSFVLFTRDVHGTSLEQDSWMTAQKFSKHYTKSVNYTQGESVNYREIWRARLELKKSLNQGVWGFTEVSKDERQK